MASRATTGRGEGKKIFFSPCPLSTCGEGDIACDVGEKRQYLTSKKYFFLMPTPIQAARALRQQMTPEEKLLWQNLRAHKFKGHKFRRQHPIAYQVFEKRSSFYVADFYCGSKKLVIEPDGKHHEFPEQREYDKARDKLMTEFGMKILRIRNDELKDIGKVLEK